MLLGDPLDEEDFAGLRTIIANDICKNYHREHADGTTAPLVAQHDFLHLDFEGFRGLFVSIRRRSQGGDMKQDTEANRAKVLKEFRRVEWPNNKPPEMRAWMNSTPMFKLFDKPIIDFSAAAPGIHVPVPCSRSPVCHIFAHVGAFVPTTPQQIHTATHAHPSRPGQTRARWTCTSRCRPCMRAGTNA